MDSHSDPPNTLQVISYNCLGLKYISKFRKERIDEIGRRISIASPVPEIVGLQECWTQEDYQSIRRQTRHILPHGKFYHSGIFGGGLAILSKWPIIESNMVRFPLNGRPTAFFRGDWYVGKGVACARIKMGPLLNDIAEVFCTHLHAPYEGEPNDSYLCHRTAQAWEIAKLMRGAAERGHLVLGLGDFNMIPLSFAHRLITAHAPVEDVWRVLHPDSSIGAAIDAVERARGLDIPNAGYNMTENGATCDSVLNTWRWSKENQRKLFKGQDVIIEESTPDPGAKRLDYIFIGKGNRYTNSKQREWQIENVKLGMTERHPTLRCSLSDHFSIEASLSRFETLSNTTLNESLMAHDLSESLPPPTYSAILEMIDTYMLRQRRQRKLRLGHFVLSVLFSIGCFVAIWWSPRPFVSFLLVFISTLGFGAGVIDGLIGGLFVGSEMRALKEFEWEIKSAREIAENTAVEVGKEKSEGTQDAEKDRVEITQSA